MNNNFKIMLLNLQKVDFSNKETGEVRTYCKIVYGVDLTKTESFQGLSILETYATSESFESLSRMLKKECVASFDIKPTQNGVKYIITKINDIKVK